MPTLPWTSIADLNPQREYFVIATRFIVTSRRNIPKVVRETQTMWPVLAASEGLLGYSLHASLIHRSLSTLTVWRDRDAMRSFVGCTSHASVMETTRRYLAKGIFVSWTAQGVDLPPIWETVGRHIREGRPGMERWRLTTETEV